MKLDIISKHLKKKKKMLLGLKGINLTYKKAPALPVISSND